MTSDETQTRQALEEWQRERVQRENRRAEERAANQHALLKGLGKETRTSYGAALFANYGELYSTGIDQFLAKKLLDPTSAGPHHSAWEFLLHFYARGPRSIAVVVLTCVIDRISFIDEKRKLAVIVGRALQDELNGTVVHDTKGELLLNTVRKRFGKKTVSKAVLRKLQVNPKSWTTAEKREVGCLLLDILMSSTNLIEQRLVGRKQLLKATEEVEELIRSSPPRPLPARRLPSLIPIEPWLDVSRNGKQLVSSRKPMDLSHINRDSVASQIQIVNHLESQAMRVDPWMANLQRQAWDENLPLFSVLRDPKSHSFVGFEDTRKRARIEESLQQAEQIAGRPIWLEHDMDFRGRIYVSSRMVGHQGPDHMKGLIEFSRGELADEQAFEQMLMAAAGHYGLSKKTWKERLDWGKQNLHVINAAAQAPLDRMDLWKQADDPWQFLQVAKAIHDWLLNPKMKVHVPIRFDQTCSGMGIIACLTRDRELARLTNCIGECREDLYAKVAMDLNTGLQSDLQGFDFKSARMAEIWLKHKISREVTKGPTLTTIYGAKHFGIVEQLVDFLMEKNPAVDVDSWDREYTWPAQYLAGKLNVVIAHRLKSCVKLETWLRSISRACMKRQRRIRFHSPMGFPLALGVEQEAKQKINTHISGSGRWKNADAGVVSGELSARATNRGITANVIHAFDASMCHAVVQRMIQKGQQVISNHDCFATVPMSAHSLHMLLHSELREHYKPDWLTEIREEAGESAGLTLPMPPIVGDLCEGEIGQNPYCFS